MTQAIYAFSGDPITYGHIDIIKRAARVFDQLIVAIGVNPDKKYMFSLAEREEMARQSLLNFTNVKVTSFKGLLVDFAYESGATVIIKGVRSGDDCNYEQTLHQIGESQELKIDTFILFARPQLAHVSSSVVKELQKEQGLIHEYVPLYVKQRLEEKISGQFLLGLTGEIAVGKSHVAEQLVKLGQNYGMQVHNLDLDKIGHQILEELIEPKYKEVREDVVKNFGKAVAKPDGSINRKKLGEIVFTDRQKLEQLNQIMYTPILVRLRRELYGKKGLILLNAALLIEAQLTDLCNNHFILLKTDKKQQEQYLRQRQFTAAQIKRRLESQYHFEQKQQALEQKIKIDKHGKVWVVENTGKDEKAVELVFGEIKDYFYKT